MNSGPRTVSVVMLTVLVCLAILPRVLVHAEPTERLHSSAASSAAQDGSETASPSRIVEEGQDLAAIVRGIEPIARATKIRRNIAHATFCLPQNILGILYYGLLQLTGNAVCTADMNETKVIVTSTPFGASLGKHIFVHTSMQTENTIRHEYGHTLQGYGHGPFYLLFEGLTSFAQAAISLCFPAFAEGYFDRWPENEANELGGVR